MQSARKSGEYHYFPARYFALISVAIILGSFLRLAWVAEQGFMEYDEGWLIDAASSMSLRLKGGHDIYVDFKASPVTIFLTALPIALFGQTAASIMYPPAILGMLGVICGALVAQRLYGPLTAVITLLIGAVSPMQVLFSRTAAIDTPGFFFLGASYVAIVWSIPRSKLSARDTILLFASGGLLGLSLAANYRALSCLFLPALVIIIREGLHFLALKKLFVHLVGFITSLGLLELALRFAYPPPLSTGFWGAFKDQYYHITSKTFGQTSSSFLPSLHIKDGLNLLLSVMDLDNVVALALAAIWVILFPFLLWKGSRRVSDLQLGVLVVIPIILFGMLTQTAARGLTVTQPFFALAAARGIILLAQLPLVRSMRMGSSIVIIALTAVTTAFGFYRSVQADVLGTRNAFDLAFKETCVKHNTGVILELDRGPGFYARRLNCKTSVLGMGASLYSLAKTHLEGYRFWLIDGQFSAYRDRFRYMWPSFEKRQPDLFIPAETYIRLDHFTSHALWLGSTYAQERQHYDDWISKWGARLPVFDLSKHILPLEWNGGSDGWYRVGDAIVAMPSAIQAPYAYKVAWDSSRSGEGAQGRFIIPDYLERPVSFGVGLCASTSGSQCDGFGFAIVATNTGIEAKLLKLDASEKVELVTVPMPKKYLNQATDVWIRCDSGTISAGFDGASVATHQVGDRCGSYNPALIARTDMPVEGLELKLK